MEEVFHYLTPCRQILRGRRQVFDYLSRCKIMAFVGRDFALTLFESNPFRTGTYSTEAFNKFPFNREAAAKVATISK